MPCFASSLLDSNRRQRALQILNGLTGQEIKFLVKCLLLVYGIERLREEKARLPDCLL